MTIMCMQTYSNFCAFGGRLHIKGMQEKRKKKNKYYKKNKKKNVGICAFHLFVHVILVIHHYFQDTISMLANDKEYCELYVVMYFL